MKHTAPPPAASRNTRTSPATRGKPRWNPIPHLFEFHRGAPALANQQPAERTFAAAAVEGSRKRGCWATRVAEEYNFGSTRSLEAAATIVTRPSRAIEPARFRSDQRRNSRAKRGFQRTNRGCRGKHPAVADAPWHGCHFLHGGNTRRALFCLRSKLRCFATVYDHQLVQLSIPFSRD